jgi:three-Cys-motif partner protein
MNPRRKGWDWWSEAKLQVLSDYLRGFTRAVRGRSTEAICLDLFAGSYENDRRHGSGTFPGSAQIALATEPTFTRLAFFELHGPAQRLRSDIEANRPDDRRWQVFEGDCNVSLPSALTWLSDVRWAPTFAFLDPRGLQVAWSTVETLANWRRDKKTKVEQWILMPEPALARVLGLQGVQGQRSADRLDRLFGSHDWLPIHQGRRNGTLTPEGMRAEFVNLYRWRLEQQLGYLGVRDGLGSRRRDHESPLRLGSDHDDPGDASEGAGRTTAST